jgi:hypothetical protein
VAVNESAGECAPAPTDPARYVLAIYSFEDETGTPTADSISVVVNGLALPRVGDRLCFDGGTTTLTPTVTEVTHWFTPSGPGSTGKRELMVSAEVDGLEAPTIRELRDPQRRRRWIAQFPMLEPDSPH